MKPDIRSFEASESRWVPTLDLESLPPGAVHRLRVELAHDGLGRPVAVPVLVARGKEPGPVFGLTTAIHGNELNGIPVLHRLFEQLDVGTLRGTLVGVVAVNVPGFLLHQRGYQDGRDLNHAFPGDPDGSSAEVYVARLLERVISRFDLLVDLHTASFGRVNSLYVRADLGDPVAAHMAVLQRPQIILHNPPADATLRGAAAERGISSITIEIGDPHRFQSSYGKRTLAGIRAVLAEQGMIKGGRASGTQSEIVVCARSAWLFTDHGGLLDVLPGLTQRVQQGELIARLRNPYGEVTREYLSPEDGIVIGRSVDPVAETGSRILHLGVVQGGADAVAEELVDEPELEDR